MAKKSAKSAKKNAKNVPAVLETQTTLSDFTVGGNLDISDVLSVVTARAEERYSQKITECQQRVKDIREEIKGIRKSLEDVAKRTLEGLTASKVKKLTPTIEEMGGTVEVSYNLNNPSAAIRICVDRYNGVSFTITAEHDPKALDAIKDLEAKVSESLDEAVGWKRKTANIPMLERRYRAKVAESKLATSDSGQELLRLLTDDLDATIEALPGH